MDRHTTTPEMLTRPEILAVGVKALHACPGDDAFKLQAAVKAMLEAAEPHTAPMEIPADLAGAPLSDLRRIANRYGIFYRFRDTRADMLRAIRREQQRRAQLHAELEDLTGIVGSRRNGAGSANLSTGR